MMSWFVVSDKLGKNRQYINSDHLSDVIDDLSNGKLNLIQSPYWNEFDYTNIFSKELEYRGEYDLVQMPFHLIEVLQKYDINKDNIKEIMKIFMKNVLTDIDTGE